MNIRLFDSLTREIEEIETDKIFILTDENVALIEKPLIEALLQKYPASVPAASASIPAQLIVTPAGEENKSLAALAEILRVLSEGKATRRALLLCIGGGMTTDIGGFAAAVFKRGIRHINVATTLLAAVDAAVGGKTGIDFNGFKNEVGAFHLPVASLFDEESFASLPQSEILSGFGEVVKTALIADAEMYNRILNCSPLEASPDLLCDICTFCRDEKMRVVEEDPTEKGLRKILNFGHTAGHAFETLALKKGLPVSHGIAIAHGILPALILSEMLLDLDKSVVSGYARWLRENYPQMSITCRDYEEIWQIATHDKKNSHPDLLSFTLIATPGNPRYDIPINQKDLFTSLDLYQELQGR